MSVGNNSFRAVRQISLTKRPSLLFSLLLMASLIVIHDPLSGQAEETAFQNPPIASASEIDFPPFCTINAAGHADGFAVELLRAALAAMGREVTFRTGPWYQVRGWLERGEVQVLPLVGRTPEREPLFDFTFPYMSLHGAIVVRQGTEKVRNLSDLAGKQVAVMKGDNAEEFLRREKRDFHIVTTRTFEDALRELSQGRHDAVVVQRLVALRLIQETGLTNLRIIDKSIEAYQQEFCFAVREGDRDALALLNEGLALVIADGTYRALHAKWFASLQLPSERPIIIGGDHHYPPFEYLDERGLPAGFTVELTRAIAREMNMNIQIRLGPWTDIMDLLKSGEIDAIQGIFYSAERERTLDFSPSYLVSHYVGVVRRDEGAPPETVEDLQDRSLVVQDGDVILEFLKAKGMGDRLSVVETQKEVLEAVSSGRFDCGLTPRVSALYLINKTGWKNLVLGGGSIFSGEYSYAVLDGHPALLAQFSEGLKVLKESGEYHRIYEKWLGIYQEKPADILDALWNSILVLAPLTLILLLVFFWSWSLRKKVESKTRALRQSEEFQRALIACSPAALYSIDRQRKVMAWNASAERIFGWSSNEVIGKPLPTIPEDKRSEFEEYSDYVLRGNSFSGVEVVRRRKDGSLFHASLWCNPIRDTRGHVIGMMNSIEDITERKKAEERQQRLQARLSQAVEMAHLGYWEYDVAQDLFHFDEAFFNIFHTTANQAPNQTMSSEEYASRFVHPDDRHVVAEEIRRARETSDPDYGGNLEHRIIYADGATGYMSVRFFIIKDVNGNTIKTFGINQDITERRLAEQSLRDSEEKYRILVENANEIILVAQGDLIRFVNSKVRDYGFALSELEGKSFIDFVHPEDRQKAIELNRSWIENQESSGVYSFRILDGAGNTKWLDIKTVGIEWEGKPATLNFITDITTRKQALDESESLQRQLIQAQKLEAIGTLAGGIAHDFNNILAAILGYTELAMNRFGKETIAEQYFEQILKAGERAKALIGQVLAFSRQGERAARPLNLSLVVKEALKLLAASLPKSIEVVTDIPPQPGYVIADPTHVHQIVMNLCTNAAHAMRKRGGRLSVSIMPCGAQAIHPAVLRRADTDHFLCLIVEDQGEGMPQSVQDRIFDPYFTTKSPDEGTGLGLAVVHGIMQTLGEPLSWKASRAKGLSFACFSLALNSLIIKRRRLKGKCHVVRKVSC